MTPYQTMVVAWSVFIFSSLLWLGAIDCGSGSTVESLRSDSNFCHSLWDPTVINIKLGYSYELQYRFKQGHPGHF